MNKEIITKKDYEILQIKENAKPEEINLAYEKLILEYHPKKIKLEKLREPNEFELKKYKEIEKVYKKFDFKHPEYICCGWKKNEGQPCTNRFYPCLWKKVEGDKRKYFCSQECYNSKYENPIHDPKEISEWKETKLREIQTAQRFLTKNNVRTEELEPSNRNWQQEISNVGEQWSEENFKKIIDIRDRIERDVYRKKEEKNKKSCDNCGKEIEPVKEGKKIIISSYGGVDNEGNHYNFCSEECREKGMKGKGKRIVKKNAFTELLKWMEKEGIIGFHLDPNSGKLVVEYGKNDSKTIEDDNLTSEQKEIKSFFQQTGKNQLNRNQIREEIEKEGKNSDKNKWIGPLVGIGIVALVVILIGVIIYKNKKKNY